jgi:hypothetical protein
LWELHAFWNLNVDFFLYITVEEHCNDVHLFQLQSQNCSNLNQHLKRITLGNSSKCLVIVDACSLYESVAHKSSLIPTDVAFSIKVLPEDPLARNSSKYVGDSAELPVLVLQHLT